MSTASGNPASIKRRRSQVFVDIPITPRNSASHTLSARDTKENSPLRPSKTNTFANMAIVKSTNTASGKRKRDDRDEHHAHDDPPPKPKKAKVADQTTHNKKQKGLNAAKSKKADTKESQATPDEFADGFFYCHQCSKKRPVSRKFSLFITRQIYIDVMW